MYFSISALTSITRLERAISIRLYNLITLQFVLRFPLDVVFHSNEPYFSLDYAILKNELWQSRGWFVRDCIDTDQNRLIIYTVPYALSYDPSLRNQTFMVAEEPNFVDFKTYQLLSWICTDVNLSATVQSLNRLNQANHLHWIFEARVRFYSFCNISQHVKDYVYKTIIL